MKKVFIFVLVVVIAISLAACDGAEQEAALEQEQATAEPTQEPTSEPTEEPTQEPTPEPTTEPTVGSLDAVVEGDAYTNEFFGLAMNVPAGYVWYTQEELTATFGVDSTSLDVSDMTQVALLPLGMCYDALSLPEQVANLNFTFTNVGVPSNDEEAMLTLEGTAKILDSALGTETVYAAPTLADYDGHHAYILDFQSYIGDEIVMSQAILLIEVEHGSLTFTYTYFTEEQLAAAIDSVNSITFSK